MLQSKYNIKYPLIKYVLVNVFRIQNVYLVLFGIHHLDIFASQFSVDKKIETLHLSLQMSKNNLLSWRTAAKQVYDNDSLQNIMLY